MSLDCGRTSLLTSSHLNHLLKPFKHPIYNMKTLAGNNLSSVCENFGSTLNYDELKIHEKVGTFQVLLITATTRF